MAGGTSLMGQDQIFNLLGQTSETIQSPAELGK